MWLKNTSRYPTDEVRRLVKFAIQSRGVDARDVQINVKNSAHAYGGRAYPRVPGMAKAAKRARYLVTLRVGTPEKFPRSSKYGYAKSDARWPVIEFGNWREAVVILAAHELTHIEQFRFGRPLSEMDCEMAAQAAVRDYRKSLEVADAA